MTLAIAHREDDGIAVLDCVREVRAPFQPEAVVADFCMALAAYGVARVTGDRYAGEWPREQFAKRKVDYVPSEKVKSDIYRDCLPLLNSRKCRLLDIRRLISQLHGLERRTARGGKDSIDHGPGQHDDVANAVAGAIVLASAYVPSIAIIEYYRREVEKMRGGGDIETVTLRAPAGVSHVYLMSGGMCLIGDDRLMRVSAKDAKPLRGAGFEEVRGTERLEHESANYAGRRR